MKTKRKKLITVMLGIILLISQQIIAGTNYTKTVTSTGGTVSATEFDATRIIAGGIAKWNNLRIKNGATVTIDFSGIPDIQSVEGSSITTAQITSVGFVEIKFKTGTGASEKEFRINLDVNYYGVPQFNGADVPSNIVITESNKNDVVSVPNITSVIWRKNSATGEVIATGSSISLTALQASGATTFVADMYDGTGNDLADGTPGGESKYTFSITPLTPTPTLSVAPASITNVAAAGESKTLTVTSNAAWTATSDQSWATLSTSSGTNNGTVNVTLAQNTGTAPRTVTLTFTAGSLTRTVTITQDGATPTLSATLASTTNVAAGGGIAGVNVVSNTNWSITTSGLPSWATLSTSSGTNNGTVNVTLAPNTGTAPRTVTLTFTAGSLTRTVTITQDGATPTLSVSPTTLSPTAAGGTATVTVTSNVAAWSVVSNQGWATVSPASGANNGTVTVTFAANTGTSPRTAKLTFSATGLPNQEVQITQPGTAPMLSVAPASITNVAAAGESKTLAVTSNVAWSVASNQPWATLSTSSGTNNGTVNVTLAPNTGTAPRTVTLTFTAGSLTRTVTITQDGATPTLSVSPTTLSPTAAGGTATVTVTSNVAAWSVVSNQGWATVSPASGANNGTVTVTFAANTGTSPRTAKLTFSATGLPNQEVQITQPGTAPMLSVAPASITNVAAAGESKTLAVTSNVAWSVASNQPWATLSTSSGTNNGTVNVTLAPNTGTAPRTVTLTFTAGSLTRTVTITQDGATPTLSVSPTTLSPTAAGGTATVTVTSNVAAWSVVSNQGWATVSPASGANNGTVTVTFAANTGTSPRTAKLTFSATGLPNQEVQITQPGTAPMLSVAPASITNVAAAGESKTLAVTSNVAWSVASNQPWATLSTSSGTNNGTVNVTLAQNTGTAPRTVTLTFTAGSLTRTVTITQDGATPTPPTPPTPPSPPTPSTPTLSLSIEVIRSNGNREMEEVEVSATGDWYIRTPDWISTTPSSGRGNRTVTFRIEENTTGVAREAKVTVTSGSLSQTVKVYQAALNPKSQKKVAKLILSDTSVVLKEKAFYHLTVDVLPIDAASKDIVWKSSDPTIATVVNGHVTILKKGEVTITVKALDGSGVSASCKIDIQSTVGNELYPEEPRVWSDGNILYIRLVKPEQVSVYTTNGQLVLHQKMNGNNEVSLSSGIYFVRIGDQETKKVAIY